MQRKIPISIRQWQAPLAGVLGLWLAVSPWVLGPTGSARLTAGCVALGLALCASAAAMAFPAKAAWGAWLTVVFGLAAAVSPWLLGFSNQPDATTNALVTGLVAAIVGFVAGLTMSDPDRLWDDRVAH